MAVVTSGNETIIRYSRGLIAVYYVLVLACGLLALVLGVAAFGQAVGSEKWVDKLWGVVGFAVGSLSFAITAIQMYMMGKSYAGTYVAVGPDELRFRLPRSDGELVHMGEEQKLKWSEIHSLTYEGNWKTRTCRFRAGDYIYTFYQNNCPSPGKVAELIAQHTGAPLRDKASA